VNACDHLLGVQVADDGEWLRVSELPDAAAYARSRHVRWLLRSIYDLADERFLPRVCDAAMGRFDLFTFCPDCGQRNPTLEDPNSPRIRVTAEDITEWAGEETAARYGCDVPTFVARWRANADGLRADRIAKKLAWRLQAVHPELDVAYGADEVIPWGA
jgi:hypothetical protein